MQSKKKLVGLQWLRALAALLVVLAHNHDVLRQHSIEFYDGWVGGIGVDVFFVISGFIMMSVMSGMPKGIASAHRFAAARIGRVVPIYWLMIALVTGLWLVTGADMFSSLSEHSHVARFVANLLFLDRHPIVTVGWTLCFEMIFYGLAAISLIIAQSQATRLALISALLLIFIAVRTGLGLIRFYPGEPMVLEFVAGSVVWLALSHWQTQTAPAIGFALIIAALVGVGLLYGHHEYNHGHPFWVLVATSLVVGVLIAEPAFASLPWRFPVVLGDASYSLYLVHVYALFATSSLLFSVAGVQPTLNAALVLSVLAIALAIVISLASYRFLERPLERRLSSILAGIGVNGLNRNSKENTPSRHRGDTNAKIFEHESGSST